VERTTALADRATSGQLRGPHVLERLIEHNQRGEEVARNLGWLQIAAREQPQVGTRAIAPAGRITSIEALRVLAILAVISIHTPRFQQYEALDPLQKLVVCLATQFYLFAVPLFFSISGYFFGTAVHGGRGVGAMLSKYWRRIIWVFVAWYAIYAVLPPNWPKAIVERIQEYGLGGVVRPFYWKGLVTLESIQEHPFLAPFTVAHLWFLPTLLLALAVLGLAITLRKERAILVSSLILYLMMVTRPYSFPYTDVAAALMFVMAGWFLSQTGYRNWKVAAGLIGIGYVFQVTEAAVWWNLFDHGKAVTCYFIATIPFVVGLLLFALSKPHIGNWPLVTTVAPLTFGIYASHLFVKNTITSLTDPRGSLWASHLITPLIIFILSAALCTVLARFNATRSLSGC
jgi:surface polysaccharide O-acyltransferase-like enzyme